MTNQHLFVFILGMHRSGTSCLAGSFERCGLHLGSVRRTGLYNAKGYYELKAVEQLHDEILGLNRASWIQPPESVRVHPYHWQALKEIADQLSQRRPCGIKDPRLVLLLDTWLTLVAPPSQLVATFRHPVAVAQSLAQRNQISFETGLKLWLYYNNLLIRRHKAEPFPIVEFDLSDVEHYCRTVASLALTLGLSPQLSHLRTFVGRDLDHHPMIGVSVPPACMEEYAYLQRHCFRTAESMSDPSAIGALRMGWLQRLDMARSELSGLVNEAAFQAQHTRPARFLRRVGQYLRLGIRQR